MGTCFVLYLINYVSNYNSYATNMCASTNAYDVCNYVCHMNTKVDILFRAFSHMSSWPYSSFGPFSSLFISEN